MTVRQNVQYAIVKLTEHEGSKAAFANKVGASKQTVNNWTNGSNAPDIETIAKIAKIYGIPISSILENTVSEKDIAELCQTWVDVPLYGSIAAGKPIEMIEVEERFPIPSTMHDRYPEAFLLKVSGSSMDRVIPNGSYALVNPTKDVVDGKVYAVCVDGFDATIKRVRKLNNGFELSPDSTDPTYVSKTFNFNEPGTETVTVIGRVVYYVLPFDWDF